MSKVELQVGDYRLALDPKRGGSVAGFEWRGTPLFRGTCGPSILDTACFPLVPFANRIAHGRFATDGREVRLTPNFPGRPHPHPLHGFGWLSVWRPSVRAGGRVVLHHEHPGGEWPWAYRAEQEFVLSGDGLRHAISLENRSREAMPAGLGLHPYMPRDGRTILHAPHRTEWSMNADGLPAAPDERAAPRDWWEGAPVAARAVDTVYAGRAGPMRIVWPARATALAVEPSPELPFTHVYVPPDASFLCVEPVSHLPDAVNRPEPPETTGLRILLPDERLRAHVDYRAEAIA